MTHDSLRMFLDEPSLLGDVPLFSIALLGALTARQKAFLSDTHSSTVLQGSPRLFFWLTLLSSCVCSSLFSQRHSKDRCHLLFSYDHFSSLYIALYHGRLCTKTALLNMQLCFTVALGMSAVLHYFLGWGPNPIWVMIREEENRCREAEKQDVELGEAAEKV